MSGDIYFTSWQHKNTFNNVARYYNYLQLPVTRVHLCSSNPGEFLGHAIVSIEDLKKMSSSRQIIPLTGRANNISATSGSITVEVRTTSQGSGGLLQTAQTWANAGVVEVVSPLQVTHLPPVWDLLLPLA